jgi:hypothetical protein
MTTSVSVVHEARLADGWLIVWVVDEHDGGRSDRRSVFSRRCREGVGAADGLLAEDHWHRAEGRWWRRRSAGWVAEVERATREDALKL